MMKKMMNKMKTHLIAVSAIAFMFFLVMTGCPATLRPNPVVPTDTDWCGKGCDHLMTLTGRDGQQGCEEARPLNMPDGSVVSCEEFCKETQDNGRSIHPSCWVDVTDCNLIEMQCRR